MSELKTKLVIIQGIGNPSLDRWSYQIREITANGKEISNYFVLRTTAQKVEPGYQFSKTLEESRDRDIELSPSEKITNSKKADDFLRETIFSLGKILSQQRNIPLENKI